MDTKTFNDLVKKSSSKTTITKLAQRCVFPLQNIDDEGEEYLVEQLSNLPALIKYDELSSTEFAELVEAVQSKNKTLLKYLPREVGELLYPGTDRFIAAGRASILACLHADSKSIDFVLNNKKMVKSAESLVEKYKKNKAAEAPQLDIEKGKDDHEIANRKVSVRIGSQGVDLAKEDLEQEGVVVQVGREAGAAVLPGCLQDDAAVLRALKKILLEHKE